MELNKYIGNRIRHFRDINNMNQEELADRLGTTKQTISRYERGQRKTDQDTLFKMADIFDVRIDDFFPAIEQDESPLEKISKLNKDDLSVEEMDFFRKLVEKTLSLEGEDRERFLDGIRFTVDYYTKMNKDKN